jgi:hypothetical protein
MVLLEIKRQLYKMYLATIASQDELKHGYDAIKDKPPQLSIHLAEGFLLWVQDWKRESTHDILQAIIQFVDGLLLGCMFDLI